MQNGRKDLRIGLTGGIGAGKTIITTIFKTLGIPVYNADTRARFLMENSEKLIGEIRKSFGNETYENGKLNREFLAGSVFNNEENLKLLNSIVHPEVLADYELWVKSFPNNLYTIKEAALLFEAGTYKDLDKVIMVDAPPDLRMQRVLLRDMHRLKEDVRKIIKNQMDDDKKRKLADFIIINDDKKLVIPQVLKVHRELVKLAENK